MNGYNYLDKFTTNAKKVLTNAQKVARDLGSAHLGTEHLLLAMLNIKSGTAFEILGSLGVSLEKADMIVTLSRKEETITKVGLTPGARRLVETAVLIAAQYGSFYIGTEHLLLAMMQDSNSEAFKVIQKLGANPAEVSRLAADAIQASADDAAGAAGPVARDRGQVVSEQANPELVFRLSGYLFHRLLAELEFGMWLHGNGDHDPEICRRLYVELARQTGADVTIGGK